MTRIMFARAARPVLCVLAVVAAVGVGCGGDIKLKPVPKDLTYDCSLFGQDPTNTRQYSATFPGTRGYEYKAGDPETLHSFIFENADDYLLVSVTDNAGLPPGQEVDFTVVHVDPVTKQPIGAYSTWKLVHVNVSGGIEGAYQFRIGPGLQYHVAPGTPVGGLYAMAITDRAVSVEMRAVAVNAVAHVNALGQRCG